MRAFGSEAKYYDLFHKDKDYAGQAREIRKRYPKAKTVLEIGSGTGLMTKELEKLGFEITMLEPSIDMLIELGKKFPKRFVYDIPIQDFPLGIRYDLVLALYDVLNYVSFKDFRGVYEKIQRLGKDHIIEVWPPDPVKWFTYKRVGNCHRIRLGFKLFDKVFLWYIFWGDGLVVSHHRLYIH